MYRYILVSLTLLACRPAYKDVPVLGEGEIDENDTETPDDTGQDEPSSEEPSEPSEPSEPIEPSESSKPNELDKPSEPLVS